VFFYNNKTSPKHFCLLDSGADHTLIPFSLGKDIGFSPKGTDEKLNLVSGISGSQSFLVRNCRVYISDVKKKMVYGFDESVWWIYPDDEMLKKEKNILDEYKFLQDIESQSKPGTTLSTVLKKRMYDAYLNLINLNSTLDTGVLLGRTFFNNFMYIQFCQRDRDQENSCFYVYQLNDKMVTHKFAVSSTTSVNE
jgi:hypothetical protein